MARPRAPEEERRSECFAIRLTPAERLALQEEAERLSLSPTSLARQRLLRGRVVVQEHRQLDPRQVFELGRIGVNLNQIARALNSGQNINPAAIEAALAELRTLLAQIVRPGGDAPAGVPEAGTGEFVSESREAEEVAPPLRQNGDDLDPAPTRPTGAAPVNKPPTGAPRGS